MNMLLREQIKENAAFIAQPSAGAAKTRLVDFFKTLGRDKNSLGQFMQQWQRLPYFDFSSQEISGILSGTRRFFSYEGKIDRAGLKELVEHWHCAEDSVMRVIGNAPIQTVCSYLHVFARLKILPESDLLDACLNRIGALSRQLTLHDAASLFVSCATLKIAIPATIRQSMIEDFPCLYGWGTTSNMINICWASAALHSLTGDRFYKGVFYTLKDRISALPESTLTKAERKRMHDSFIWFEQSSPISNETNPETVSNMERRVASELIKLGYSVDDRSQPIPIFKKAVDFSLRYKGADILVEIDGPYHYLKNIEDNWYSLSGETSFRSALCHMQAPQSTILRIPHMFIEAWVKEPKDIRGEDIDFIFREALANGPGVHNVVIDDDGLSVQPILHPVFRPQQHPAALQHAGPALQNN